MWLSLQFTHHCHNYTHLVSIYALLLRFMMFCHNLRTSVAIFASLSQFTHFCRGARDSAIYAFWEPKKLWILGSEPKKQNFQPWSSLFMGRGSMIRSNTDRRDRWTSYWLIQHLNTHTVWYNLVLTMILLTGSLKVVSLRRRMKIRVSTLCFWLEILRFSLRHQVRLLQTCLSYQTNLKLRWAIVLLSISVQHCVNFSKTQSVRQSLKTFQRLSECQTVSKKFSDTVWHLSLSLRLSLRKRLPPFN